MPRSNQYQSFGRSTRVPVDLVVPEGLRDDVYALVRFYLANTSPGHFAPAEIHLLVQHCQAVARCVRGEAAIEAEGDVIVVNGKPIPNPWLGIVRDARKEVGVLATKLRLAPNARIESKQAKAGDGSVTVDFSKLGGAQHD